MRLLSATVLVLSLLLTSCTKFQDYKPGFAGATGGEALERALWDAVKAKDRKEIDAHLAGTFLFVSPWVLMDRAATSDHLQTMDLAEYSISELRVEANGPDAVVTYVFSGRGTVRGQAMNGAPMRMMTVWQQVKSGWVATVHTEMPVMRNQ